MNLGSRLNISPHKSDPIAHFSNIYKNLLQKNPEKNGALTQDTILFPTSTLRKKVGIPSNSALNFHMWAVRKYPKPQKP